jgi:hypothetical protein
MAVARTLGEDMGDLAADETDRGLSSLVDRGELGLYEGDPTTTVDLVNERERVHCRRETAGVTRSRRNRRLDDDLAVQAGECVTWTSQRSRRPRSGNQP